jgi:hypothetical protein
MESLWPIHLAITSGLCVLIWLVQVTHYPLFHYIDPDRFKEAMLVHQAKISWIVIPLMTAELGLSLFTLHIPSIIFVCLIWGTTFFVQVPLHDQLAKGGYQYATVKKLVNSNWIRTFLWTGKLIFLCL